MSNFLSYDLILKENQVFRKYLFCPFHENNTLHHFCECGKPACGQCEKDFHVGHKLEDIGMLLKPKDNGGLYFVSLFPFRPMSYYRNRRKPSLQSPKFTELMTYFDALEKQEGPKKCIVLQKNDIDSDIYIFEVEVRIGHGLVVIEKVC